MFRHFREGSSLERGRLAQLVEHRPYKAVAAGSSPAAPTMER